MRLSLVLLPRVEARRFFVAVQSFTSIAERRCRPSQIAGLARARMGSLVPATAPEAIQKTDEGKRFAVR